MPYLQPPAIWMPQATQEENKILRFIYVRISADRGTPSPEFINTEKL